MHNYSSPRSTAPGLDPSASPSRALIGVGPAVAGRLVERGPDARTLTVGTRVQKGESLCFVWQAGTLHPVLAPVDGCLVEMNASPGRVVLLGEPLFVIDPLV